LTGLLLISILVPFYIDKHDNGTTPIPPTHFESDEPLHAKIESSYLYVIISHLVVYLIVSLLRFTLHRLHYRRLRVIGYHSHYRSTVWLNKSTSWIFHRANGLILLATALVCHYLEDQGIIPVHMGGAGVYSVRPINILQSLIVLAVSIALPILFRFLLHELRFRRDRKPPDVFCLDNPAHLQHAGLSEIGIRSTSYLEDLLERQADLIYNLKLQNSYLRLTLHRATAQNGVGPGHVSEGPGSGGGGGDRDY